MICPGFSGFRRCFSIGVAILIGVGGPACACFAQINESTEIRYLAGLRQRELFGLAEAYCRRELSEAYTSDRRRAELTIELSRTSLEAALYARSPEREALFAQAAKVLDDELRARPAGQWRLPVEVQRALVDLVWGERLREEAQTLSSGNAAMEQAREKLRSAVALLKQARAPIEERLLAAHRKPGEATAAGAPTANEWSSLKRNVDYQLARAYRNQGESYPPQSNDRLAALEQAAETLAPLTRADMYDAVAWQARLDEAHCRRLLGDLNAAERVLDLVDSQAPPREIADRARALRIRNRVAADKLDEAQQFFRADDAEPAAAVEPEVRLAELEWLVFEARKAAEAADKAAAADAQTKAAAMARLIEERHSPYWARRAETLLAASVAAAPAHAHDDGALAQAAASFFRQGNVEKALELYDQMFVEAAAKKNADAAFSAAFTAAAVEQQRGRAQAAALRYEKLAAALPEHPRAAEAQLLAAYNLGQSLTALSDSAAIQAGLARYAQALEQHVRTWPSDRTSAQARVWLARVYLQQRRTGDAATVLRVVPPADPLAAEAVGLIAQAAAAELAAAGPTTSGPQTPGPRTTDAAPPPAVEAYRQALSAFANGAAPAGATSPAARAAAREAAMLRLRFADDRDGEAARGLQALLAQPDLTPEQQGDARLWLLVAEAAAGKLDAALALSKQLAGTPRADAAAAVARLDAFAARAPAAERAQWADLVMAVVEHLRPQRGAFPNWITEVAPAEARALALRGQIEQARRVWDELVAAQPANVLVLAGYAQFLLSSTDRESLTLAAAKWREVESRSRESSPEWYRARLGMARAYLALGDRARAKQIVDLTQALHPDLGGEELKPQFEALK